MNASGGVVSSNPIGASGMLRTALGHAYWGAAQHFAMWILRNEKP